MICLLPLSASELRQSVCWPSLPLSRRECRDGSDEAADGGVEPPVVERRREITGGVVVRVAVKRRVGGHECPVAVAPERGVVAPADPGNPAESGAGLQRQGRSPPECGRRA